MNDYIVGWVWIIGFLFVNVLFSIPVAYVANQKGRSAFGFFFLSFFLSFIVGILVVIALPAKEHRLATATENVAVGKDGVSVKCPYCAEWVKSEAKVCKHCGREIEKEVKKALTLEETLQSQNHALHEEKVRQLKEQSNQQRQDFLKSTRFKVLAGISVAVIAGLVTLGLVAVFTPKPSPWKEILADCGRTGNYSLNGDTLTLKPLFGNYGETTCILGAVSQEASDAYGRNKCNVTKTYTGTYKITKGVFAGKTLEAEWNPEATKNYCEDAAGWGKYTIK